MTPRARAPIPSFSGTGHPDRLVPDSDLVQQARRGDAAALGQIYARYAGSVLRLARRITGNESDAEDVLHDLFAGLPELLSKYDHRDRLDAWLRGVAARHAVGRLRRQQRRDRIVEPLADPTSIPTRAADPWNAIDLERAIAALSDNERAVFVLRQLEGYSHDEIASLLGVSSGAVRVRFLRALKHLRNILEPES